MELYDLHDEFSHEEVYLIEGLEVYEHNTAGYQPRVYSRDWMVALLNHEDIMRLENALEIERHAQTDEVFILLNGQAALYLVAGDRPLQVVEMKPGSIFNVLKGTWHNLLATEEAKFAIIENRDTDKYDTEIRKLTEMELEVMHRQLPDWIK